MSPLSIFRAPNTPFPSSSLPPLTPAALLKTWWVTTSTLPMWKSAKNIRITYTSIPSTKNIDDIIHYNPRSGPPATNSTPEEAAKLVTKSIHGVDYPLSENDGDLTYKWRGKGLLFIATSRWQVVGYGGRDVRTIVGEGGEEVLEGVEWVVTYFEKSLFTPAGVDVMTVAREGVDGETLGAIGEGLKGIGGVLGELWDGIFDIPRD
ncbi:hypothetical protein AOL_s00004g325 [Orbilia oligospora ATCC 24927]|uniref:Uncharacterized protein n=2 Tax=Orbilia oligospora TaxID=2813651 RepID=G1WYG5_ARTOA|nr:hypothetical protein AOL_s00004g325 [Orbilia oligospora ATCC 24927]EGX54292.1 hypothetical protein AOL_s00004g325 [Orbilia oligospora ATCC 24927]KAF3285943.1 hypothetical protein TWF970_009510 [Orbilia oligospora]